MSETTAAAAPDSWRDRLRDAAEEELARLLEERRDELDARAVRQAFRNPYLTRAMIEGILADRRLVSAYEVRRDAAFHPRTGRLEALALVSGLYWADLVRLGVDTRVHPVVRRAADQRLLERLPGLAVGEKMAIARGASPGVLAVLRADPTPRVIGALLENPRLTEGILMPLAAGEHSSPRALGVIAANPKWSTRHPIRVALCRNPRTPLEAVLPMLPALLKSELEAIASDLRLLLPVRRRAELLSGGGRSRSRGTGRAL
jgi:hypothetical protein